MRSAIILAAVAGVMASPPAAYNSSPAPYSSEDCTTSTSTYWKTTTIPTVPSKPTSWSKLPAVSVKPTVPSKASSVSLVRPSLASTVSAGNATRPTPTSAPTYSPIAAKPNSANVVVGSTFLAAVAAAVAFFA